MNGKRPFWQHLPDARSEQVLPDAKPAYGQREAMSEAQRCLYCYDAPCIQACPTAIDIPGFIREIGSNNLRASATTIFKANMLGYSCARVCPVEELCAGACVYHRDGQQPVAIGRLQRYATEQALAQEQQTGQKLFEAKPAIGRKVALIGAGPASLACAAYLALEGVEAVIYERSELPGGLNTTGIAPYKFQADDALNEAGWLLDHGVSLKTGVAVGENPSFSWLRENHDAVFIGVGLGGDRLLKLPGSDGPGYWGATDLIAKIKSSPSFQLPPGLKRVLVIGGGNTAIDIARELAMLGVPQVSMVYRRSASDMSGYEHEMQAARRHGVTLITRATPRAILRKDDNITAMEIAHGAQGNTETLPCDWVVEAIGQKKHASRLGPEIPINESGLVIVNPRTRETPLPGVYAGGDCINGGKEVVNAAADGRDAAFAMLRGWGISPALATE